MTDDATCDGFQKHMAIAALDPLMILVSRGRITIQFHCRAKKGMDQLSGVFKLFKTVLDATTGNDNCLIRFSFSGADDDDCALFRSGISPKPWMDNPIWRQRTRAAHPSCGVADPISPKRRITAIKNNGSPSHG